MIFYHYTFARGAFALDGAPATIDGLEEWPQALLRANGFTGLVTPTISSYPITITCNAGASDAVLGTHEFAWWLSQRTDATAPKYFTITHPNLAKSGTVQIALNLDIVAGLLRGKSGPDLLTADSKELLFKNVHLYVSRRSDRAYQWIDLSRG